MIAIDHLRQIRTLYGQLVNSMSDEQLFAVPQGFRNHVAWNAAHVVVTQQLLSYSLSGLEPQLSSDLIDGFRKGTSAEDATPEAFRAVMEQLHTTADRLAEDYAAGRFEQFQEYATSAGITLHNIDEALAFNNLHEGIHLGYILALRKSLGITTG